MIHFCFIRDDKTSYKKNDKNIYLPIHLAEQRKSCCDPRVSDS